MNRLLILSLSALFSGQVAIGSAAEAAAMAQPASVSDDTQNDSPQFASAGLPTLLPLPVGSLSALQPRPPLKAPALPVEPEDAPVMRRAPSVFYFAPFAFTLPDRRGP